MTVISWWIAGALVATVWVSRVIAAAFGIRHVANLADRQWGRTPSPPPRISIIVPARDEVGAIEPALRSLLALDYPTYEVVVVNDRSTDATGEIAQRLASPSAGKLRVIHVQELPPHWLGKPHAMWLGAKVATGEWLVFTDADVVYCSDALGRAVAYAEAAPCDHLAAFPDIVMNSVGEQMMIGLFQCSFLFWPRAWKVGDPRSSDYCGVGAFNMIRRSAYDAIGTFAALRMEVVEDLKLGKLVKRHGFRQRAAFAHGILKIRWINGIGGFVRNLSKNFFAVFHFRISVTLASCLGFGFIYMLPWIGLIIAPGMARIPFGISLLCIAAAYVGMAKTSEVRFYSFFLQPFAAVIATYAILRSMFVTLRNGGVTWRGTKYPLDELRKGLV